MNVTYKRIVRYSTVSSEMKCSVPYVDLQYGEWYFDDIILVFASPASGQFELRFVPFSFYDVMIFVVRPRLGASPTFINYFYKIA